MESNLKKPALTVSEGWSGHSPKKCTGLFDPWLQEQGYEVEISDNKDVYLDADKLKSPSLIVPVWTQGEITREQSSGIRSVEVLLGGGIAVRRECGRRAEPVNDGRPRSGEPRGHRRRQARLQRKAVGD
jgi:type 1 glutamine amidotransferase